MSEDIKIEIEEGLQTLEDIGALAPSQKISVKDLLNPDDETPVKATVTSVEQIFEEKLQAADTNSETQAEVESKSEPAPTSQEAMKALSTLFRYIEADTCAELDALDWPLQKFERLIGNRVFESFRKQTTLTDFFKPSPTQDEIQI